MCIEVISVDLLIRATAGCHMRLAYAPDSIPLVRWSALTPFHLPLFSLSLSRIAWGCRAYLLSLPYKRIWIAILAKQHQKRLFAQTSFTTKCATRKDWWLSAYPSTCSKRATKPPDVTSQLVRFFACVQWSCWIAALLCGETKKQSSKIATEFFVACVKAPQLAVGHRKHFTAMLNGSVSRYFLKLVVENSVFTSYVFFAVNAADLTADKPVVGIITYKHVDQAFPLVFESDRTFRVPKQ